MSAERFWSLIEDAWQSSAGMSPNERQQKLLDDPAVFDDALKAVIKDLTASLNRLSTEDLLAFDQILAQKLYDIDRSDIHKYTDGSDDGFLYARGFIVAMGQQYYTSIQNDPSKAIMDCACEEMGYLSARLYRERTG